MLDMLPLGCDTKGDEDLRKAGERIPLFMRKHAW